MRSHSTDILNPSSGSLDDFAPEASPSRTSTAPACDDAVLAFECEPQPSRVLAASGPMLDVATPAAPSPERPAPLSRLESNDARRQRQSRLRRFATVARRLGARTWRLPSRAHDRDSDGVIIAALLAIAAIGYGSFLTVTWRESNEVRAASLPAPTAFVPARVTVVAVPAAVSMAGFAPAAVAAAVEPEPIVVRRGGALTARTLTAMWRRRDTRSLEQAFAGLRSQTLALHRCAMRKSGNDRAVARCESEGATWTIDFQRAAGRWQIASVSTR